MHLLFTPKSLSLHECKPLISLRPNSSVLLMICYQCICIKVHMSNFTHLWFNWPKLLIFCPIWLNAPFDSIVKKVTSISVTSQKSKFSQHDHSNMTWLINYPMLLVKLYLWTSQVEPLSKPWFVVVVISTLFSCRTMSHSTLNCIGPWNGPPLTITKPLGGLLSHYNGGSFVSIHKSCFMPLILWCFYNAFLPPTIWNCNYMWLWSIIHGIKCTLDFRPRWVVL